MVKCRQSDAGRMLRNSCTVVMKMCWHLQSEHTAWMDHVQSDKVGFVLWAPCNQNTAWRHLEKKKPGIPGQISMVLFWFFFFPSLEKGRICFCARWKERTFSVPEEFSGNFWFLHCLIALWSPVLGEVQPFLPPGSLQSWAFTCWEFLFPFKDMHLNGQIFPLSNFFREGVCDEGTDSTKGKKKKESSSLGAQGTV